jgi:hypothetical protein
VRRHTECDSATANDACNYGRMDTERFSGTAWMYRSWPFRDRRVSQPRPAPADLYLGMLGNLESDEHRAALPVVALVVNVGIVAYLDWALRHGGSIGGRRNQPAPLSFDANVAGRIPIHQRSHLFALPCARQIPADTADRRLANPLPSRPYSCRER